MRDSGILSSNVFTEKGKKTEICAASKWQQGSWSLNGSIPVTGFMHFGCKGSGPVDNPVLQPQVPLWVPPPKLPTAACKAG